MLIGLNAERVIDRLQFLVSRLTSLDICTESIESYLAAMLVIDITGSEISDELMEEHSDTFARYGDILPSVYADPIYMDEVTNIKMSISNLMLKTESCMPCIESVKVMLGSKTVWVDVNL